MEKSLRQVTPRSCNTSPCDCEPQGPARVLVPDIVWTEVSAAVARADGAEASTVCGMRVRYIPVNTARDTSKRWAAAAVVAVPLLSVLLTGCAPDDTAVPSVATFDVEGQTYKIELNSRELVNHARQLLDGDEVASIPVGKIVRDDPSINEPWSWHIDPASVEFADFTTEVCDGLPEYVEDGTLTSDTYCPWGAKITALDPLE